MENTVETTQTDSKPKKNRGFWEWTVIVIRSLFILLFAVILLGGLYFKAPWKILTLDAVLLSLLTIVPKKKRKYGWMTLGIAVLTVAIWIFIPEKDSGEWKPYTFDAELEALEAERAVVLEDNAAPLYEALSEQWKQIEESDPFPEEADDNCKGTRYRPWTTDEFPEIAAWLDRHQVFFWSVITATRKPACYFPAVVTVWDLSESMDRLTPMKRFAEHLIRASYRDIGENKNGAWEKQTAVLNLAKHIGQQPMLIDSLLGLATENMALSVMREILVNTDQLSHLTASDYRSAITPIRTSHFNGQEKWKQILACEKLLTKNVWGMFYEINPEGQVRYSRFESFIDIMNETYPDEQTNTLAPSCWTRADRKLSRIIFWFSGLPRDPEVVSDWIDEAYAPLERIIEIEPYTFSEIDTLNIPCELNYKYMSRQLTQIALPSFQGAQKIFDKVRINKKGTEIICDIVFYRNQHGQFPNILDDLWPSGEERQVISGLYGGFVYHKTDGGFKLYHIGQNGVDEKGQYKMSEYDPNEVDLQGLLDRKPVHDDILIWPDELEDVDS